MMHEQFGRYYRHLNGEPIGADDISNSKPSTAKETRKYSRFLPLKEFNPLHSDHLLEIHFLAEDGTYQARKIEEFPLAPFKQDNVRELKVIVTRFSNPKYVGTRPEELTHLPLAELAPRGCQYILTLSEDEKTVIAQHVTSPTLTPQRRIKPITEYLDAYLKAEKK